MAIKKLQNNYTTPDQSKRLLELGVPADSADMYYKHTMLAPYIFSDGVLFSAYSKVEDIVPCWSVGRLINLVEIYAGMECVDFETLAWEQGTWVEKLIILIEDLIRYDRLDFSELED